MADVKSTNSAQNGKRRDSSRRGSNVSFGTLPSSADPGMRRRSTFRGAMTGIMGLLMFRRNTLQRSKSEDSKMAIKYMNSYRLEPEARKAFPAERIRKTAEDLLKSNLENITYSESTCGTLTCNIADMIKNRVKDMNIPRYRIICHVIITEEKGQGIEAASRCVWNDKTDNYACASYENSSVAAIAMVHGVYLE